MVYQKEIGISTAGHGETHDLTRRVQTLVRESGIVTGVVNVFIVGSTGAIGAIELEPGLAQDLPTLLNRLIPPSTDYSHEQTWHDGNGHSHLQATMLGPSLTLPVVKGELATGSWQQVFFIECDIKPRRRNVIVTVYGE